MGHFRLALNGSLAKSEISGEVYNSNVFGSFYGFYLKLYMKLHARIPLTDPYYNLNLTVIEFIRSKGALLWTAHGLPQYHFFK